MASPGLYAQVACIWEATARKPGNVHRYRDFADAGYVDFLLSAAAVAPALDAAAGLGVGVTVLECVRRTRAVAATNTNLGILLLLTPLAAVPVGEDLRTGVARVLAGLDVEDARQVYAAIRLAAPAGLGRVPAEDVRDEPTRGLREVMGLAGDRDLVARQYVNGFAQVLGEGVPALARALAGGAALEDAIVGCHVALLAAHPDSLIGRKRGRAEAEEASRRARQVLDAGGVRSAGGRSVLDELDAWLTAEGHARNPGTTADLVAASLFAALRAGTIPLPPDRPWSAAG